MKKQAILIDASIYALFMFMSCLVTLFAEILITKVVNNLFVMTPFSLCVLRVFIYSGGVLAILGIISFKEGYKTLECSVSSSLISGGIAVVIHFFFSLLFSFDAFCSGPVVFVSALMKYGTGLTYDQFKNGIERFDCMSVFFVYGLVYVLFMLGMKYVGVKRRIHDRDELLEKKVNKTDM